MNRNEYNGWTNYETWACALWLDNDEGSALHAEAGRVTTLQIASWESDGLDVHRDDSWKLFLSLPRRCSACSPDVRP